MLRDRVVVRIAGDSGDGIQLAGGRFSAEAALLGNDLATLPSFPAEIRAPAGSLSGVSSFQIQLADCDILTAGDRPDVLVAMNPAALRANVDDLPRGAVLVVDADEFTSRNLTRAGYGANPLEDGSLDERFDLHAIPMTSLTTQCLQDSGLSNSETRRATTLFALGLLSWMFARSGEGTEQHLRGRFAKTPALAEANIQAFRTGHAFGETTESFAVRFEVAPAALPPGRYRQITGNTALAYGILAAGHLSGLPVFFGSYPITPASDILHELSKHTPDGVTTFQAEDEIAGIGAALGAAFGGALGVTATSGPGMALKSEILGLAVALELPLIVVDVQRGGPSTGLPTKTEQTDLLQAIYGRSGESPLPVLAARSPADCFATVLEAARIAITYRTPVVVLSDGLLANGSEPWSVPRLDELARIDPGFCLAPNAPDGSGKFWPYLRDTRTGARPWAIPGTAGLEHRIGGLEKSDGPGEISQDPANHDRMVRLRAAKVAGVEVPDVVVDDPSGEADLVVLGWGSTYGAIATACRRVRQLGRPVAHVHLRHLNPLPENLIRVLGGYRRVLVPELNTGQLALLLRAQGIRVVCHNKVTGQPFRVDELQAAILSRPADGGPSPTAPRRHTTRRPRARIPAPEPS